MEYAPTTAPTQSSDAAATSAAHANAGAKVISPDMAEAIARGYEAHDIGIRGVLIFLAGLAGTIVIVLAFIYVLMFGLSDFMHMGESKASPLAFSHAPVNAPLQPSIDHNTYDREDMLQMRKDVQSVLNSSGTTATGRRHITIEEAISQVLGQLPIRPSTSK